MPAIHAATRRLLATCLAGIAIVYIATIALATIIPPNVNKSLNMTTKDAADMFRKTTVKRAAEWFLNTIRYSVAEWFQNIIKR